MWFELRFTCSSSEQLKQYNRLTNQGYTAMIGPESTVFVNDGGYRTGVMLSLKLDSCTVTEHKDFTSLLASHRKH